MLLVVRLGLKPMRYGLEPPADDMGANGFRFKILGRVLRLVFHLSWTLRLLKGELAEKHLATLRGVESSEDGS